MMLKRARTAAALLLASLTTTVTQAQSASPGSKPKEVAAVILDAAKSVGAE